MSENNIPFRVKELNRRVAPRSNAIKFMMDFVIDLSNNPRFATVINKEVVKTINVASYEDMQKHVKRKEFEIRKGIRRKVQQQPKQKLLKEQKISIFSLVTK